MRFIFQVFAAMALMTGASAQENLLHHGILVSSVFGDNLRGSQFKDDVTPGQVVKDVIIRAGKRVDGVGITVASPSKEPVTFYNGGSGGDPYTLTLEPGEHITTIETHWGKMKGFDRVTYIKLFTNKNNTISAGKPTKKIGTDTAPQGFQLGGFLGSCGDELDSVGPIWTTIKPVE
ncbi:Hypothetical protein PHPALM_10912 [Phytophthora palmivora]|uniref:Jacalin-type lectin domain-containing protein n=1 Tax=Phytophthora palmivora TaxID=4796 RepID=A0A2P4Y3K4_9STRA|nr:Hypothetical protein PHPALM_10912 [Phytophthora palmivora]